MSATKLIAPSQCKSSAQRKVSIPGTSSVFAALVVSILGAAACGSSSTTSGAGAGSGGSAAGSSSSVTQGGAGLGVGGGAAGNVGASGGGPAGGGTSGVGSAAGGANAGASGAGGTGADLTAGGASSGAGGCSASAGPNGSIVTVNACTVLHTIPRDIYGTNIAAWTGLNNSGETAYAARMQAAGVTQIRWPGGSYSDILDWSNIACQGSGLASTDDAVAFLAKFGGAMEPIVSYSGFWCNSQHSHADTVTRAASWVRYMNVTHAYATKIWEVGNEVYGNWEQGYTTDGGTYGSNFVDYYQAMKAVDPSIQIGAVTLPNPNDTNNWTTKSLSAMRSKGVTPDFLVVHEYPYSGTGSGAQVDSGILANLSQVAGWTKALDGDVTAAFGAAQVGKIAYRMTEYSGTLSPTVATVEYVQAMFAAEFMLELASYGWSGANLWAAKNGAESGGGDWGFLDSNNNPHPDYYVFPILAKKFGNAQVSATSTMSSVRSYAAKDSAGNLTLFLANNSATSAVSATVSVSGFTPAATGNKWVLLPAGSAPSGAPQEAKAIQINGSTNPDPSTIATMPGVSQAGGNGFTVDLPASALVLVVLPPVSAQ